MPCSQVDLDTVWGLGMWTKVFDSDAEPREGATAALEGTITAAGLEHMTDAPIFIVDDGSIRTSWVRQPLTPERAQLLWNGAPDLLYKVGGVVRIEYVPAPPRHLGNGIYSIGRPLKIFTLANDQD